MSNQSRSRLLDEVAAAVRMHQNAVDALDEAATDYLGINRTDMRCLDIIERRGGAAAGELARESGLSTGAITAAVDRLERAGYVRRVRDSVDRRRVMVELTEDARRCTMDCYGPVVTEGMAELQRYSDEQLELIRDFMRDGYDFLSEQATRLRGMAPSEQVSSETSSG